MIRADTTETTVATFPLTFDFHPTPDQLRATAHLFGVLDAGIQHADEQHVGYVRMTLPDAHARDARDLLAQLLGLAKGATIDTRA